MKLLYTGLPGTGKTTKLTEHYLAFKKEPFITTGYFIVPTAEQADRVTQLILEKKDIICNKNILTLDHFVEKFAGQRAINSVAQQFILRKVMRELPLEYFNGVREHLAFYEHLAGLLNELKIYQAADLEKTSIKQQELKAILLAYNNYLTENKLIDRADQYLLCSKKLQNEHFEFIILDGFTTFNSRQEELLIALSKQSDHFFASLLNFTHYKTTAELYKNLGLETIALVENKRTAKPALLQITNNFLKSDNIPLGSAENIEILIGNNRLTELEQIARQILKLKENYNWSDFCLIFRQIGNYQPLLQEVFDNYDIPLTIHEGLYLHKNSFISWLTKFIQLPFKNYEREDLFFVLKAGFYRFPKAELNKLENIALTNLIADEKDNWLKLSQEISAELHSEFLLFFNKLEKFTGVTTFGELKNSIIELIGELDLFAGLKNLTSFSELISPIKDISRAYQELLSLLTELNELQDRPEPLPELIKELEHFLTQKIITVKERQGDQVQVYDSPVARQKEYKVVFLVNLTTRSVPLALKEDLFLKDYERQYLRKTTDKLPEEEYLFYLSATRASEKLFLSYAANELNGAKLEPSPYLKKISALFTPQAIKENSAKYSESIPALNECLTIKDLQTSLIYHLYKQYDNAELLQLLTKTKELELIGDLIRHNKDLSEYAEYQRTALDILENLKEFGAKSIETLSSCRFAFLASAILKITDPQELALAIPAGEIIHETLNTYYQEKKPLNEILETNLEKNRQKLSFLHKHQLKIELDRIEQKIELFLEQEKLELEKRTYQPALFETAVSKEFAGIKINARIDRVDQFENKALLLDYKTGLLPELRLSRIEEGLIPQVWLYCLLLTGTNSLEIAGCEYLQVPKYTKKGIYLETEKEALGRSKSRSLFSTEKREELFKLTRKFLVTYLNEIRSGKFYARQGSCLDYCQFKNICRMKEQP
jgi:ATP-dependent helicase/DNAse subunit B